MAKHADANAGVLIAVDLTIGRFLLAQQPGGLYAYLFNVFAIVLLAISAFFGGLVIYPRILSSGTSLVFWGDIASRGGLNEYRKDLSVLGPDEVEKEYA